MAKREKLFKIGEVMEYSGVSRQTLHNYTLAGLIAAEKRTRAGHRLYDESVFDYLDRIKMLQKENYTLMQIKELFQAEKRIREQQEKRQLSIDFE